jgi:glutaminase
VEAAFANAKLPENVQELIENIFEETKGQDGGKTAQYIPELASAEPEVFAIALVDCQGNIYKVGDTEASFSIQSTVKPFLYGIAIKDQGEAAVHQKVGNEPSGQPFDALSIDSDNKCYNPMVNAGAILCTSLHKNTSNDVWKRFEKIEELLLEMAVDKSTFILDKQIYASESKTNSNNQMIVKELVRRGLMSGANVNDPAAALNVYTMACSMSTDVVNSACMAATLANQGVNPVSKAEVISPEIVNQMVTVMMSCGMYNGAGKWIVDVGVPAKSGVSGVIMGVVPGVCGISVFSPRLDVHNNSTRGVRVAMAMSEALGLHVLKTGAPKGGARTQSTNDADRTTMGDGRQSEGSNGKAYKKFEDV